VDNRADRRGAPRRPGPRRGTACGARRRRRPPRAPRRRRPARPRRGARGAGPWPAARAGRARRARRCARPRRRSPARRSPRQGSDARKVSTRACSTGPPVARTVVSSAQRPKPRSASASRVPSEAIQPGGAKPSVDSPVASRIRRAPVSRRPASCRGSAPNSVRRPIRGTEPFCQAPTGSLVWSKPCRSRSSPARTRPAIQRTRSSPRRSGPSGPLGCTRWVSGTPRRSSSAANAAARARSASSESVRPDSETSSVLMDPIRPDRGEPRVESPDRTDDDRRAFSAGREPAVHP
jgi:hypothetical protein